MASFGAVGGKPFQNDFQGPKIMLRAFGGFSLASVGAFGRGWWWGEWRKDGLLRFLGKGEMEGRTACGPVVVATAAVHAHEFDRWVLA